MSPRGFVRWVLLSTSLVGIVAVQAHGAASAEIRCRQALAGGGLDYARSVTRSRSRCLARILGNKLSPTADCRSGNGDDRSSAALARATENFDGRVTRACSPALLSALDYPGPCAANEEGEPFDAPAASACIRSRVDEAVVALLGVYAPAPTGFVSRKKARCVERTMQRGFSMLLRELRARLECLARGGDESDAASPCRAPVPPYGPGTGDARTDRRIVEARVRVASIAEACAITDLDSLGHSGVCEDPTGASFSPIDLRGCVFNATRGQVDPLLATLAPSPPRCGNGIVEGDEQCDDGADNSDTEPDTCRTNCTEPTCGDGVVDTRFGTEECDDGPRNSDTAPNACRRDCRNPSCGDGVVDPAVADEECDDGNAVSNDGCSASCHREECGDAIVQTGEQCDDGFVGNSNVRPDACRTNCMFPACGDGVVDPSNFEQCDDGNAVQSDGCRNDCTLCGDGILAGTEQCDDGEGNSDSTPDACRTDCTNPICGDGVVDPSNLEQCDPAGPSTCASNQACEANCACRLACPGSYESQWLAGTGNQCMTNDDCLVGECDPALARCRTATRLDVGWSGLAHRNDITGGVSVRVDLDCPTEGESCGVCTIEGVDSSARNCRCSGDVRRVCDQPFTTDAENCSFGPCIDTGACVDGRCSGAPDRECLHDSNCATRCAQSLGQACGSDEDCGPQQCVCYLGPPQPIAGAGSSKCVVSRLLDDLSGTVNVDRGDAQTSVHAGVQVFHGILSRAPCPLCGGVCADDPDTLCVFDDECESDSCLVDGVANDGVRGGRCVYGPNQGLSCDAMGRHPSYPARYFKDGGAAYSLDCPPPPGALISFGGSGVPISYTEDTGVTVFAASLPCGVDDAERCHCGNCTVDSLVGCATNADCVAQGSECSRVRSIACNSDSDCVSVDGGSCRFLGPVNRCERDFSQECETNADCKGLDGGTCALSTCTERPGAAGTFPLPNLCTDRNCVESAPGQAQCASVSDRMSYCEEVVEANGDGVIPCADNHDCALPYTTIGGGTCSLTERFDCFPEEIVAAGVPDPEFPTVASTYCLGPLSTSGINSVIGLPGPVRREVQTRTRFFCASDPDVPYLPGIGGCPANSTSR